VWEILVLHTAAIRADLLRPEEDSAWPDNPIAWDLLLCRKLPALWLSDQPANSRNSSSARA
jgi:hypothetical protein